MKLILCGDVLPTENTLRAFDEADLEGLMGDTLPLLKMGDATIGNLECALTDRNTPIRKCGPNLKGRPEHARVLASCGFTHLGMSNNHVMDFGRAAMRDTAEAIRSAGMMPFGFGEDDRDSRRPLFIEKDGMRIAVIAVCEHEYSYAGPHSFGANPFDPFDTMEDIALAKTAAQRVIVMYHGGKEQCPVPSPRLQKACRAMIRAGADFVTCQHSHCIGCMEEYRGGKILYGQGNFNFVWHGDDPQWRSGLLLELDITTDSLTCTPHPVTAGEHGISLVSGDEKAAILAGLFARSDLIRDDEKTRAAWEAFCRDEKQSYYVRFVQEGFATDEPCEACKQIFPHYLDCEAHLDVWKTLFPTWHGAGKSEMQ